MAQEKRYARGNDEAFFQKDIWGYPSGSGEVSFIRTANPYAIKYDGEKYYTPTIDGWLGEITLYDLEGEEPVVGPLYPGKAHVYVDGDVDVNEEVKAGRAQGMTLEEAKVFYAEKCKTHNPVQTNLLQEKEYRAWVRSQDGEMVVEPKDKIQIKEDLRPHIDLDELIEDASKPMAGVWLCNNVEITKDLKSAVKGLIEKTATLFPDINTSSRVDPELCEKVYEMALNFMAKGFYPCQDPKLSKIVNVEDPWDDDFDVAFARDQLLPFLEGERFGDPTPHILRAVYPSRVFLHRTAGYLFANTVLQFSHGETAKPMNHRGMMEALHFTRAQDLFRGLLPPLHLFKLDAIWNADLQRLISARQPKIVERLKRDLVRETLYDRDFTWEHMAQGILMMMFYVATRCSDEKIEQLIASCTLENVDTDFLHGLIKLERVVYKSFVASFRKKKGGSNSEKAAFSIMDNEYMSHLRTYNLGAELVFGTPVGIKKHHRDMHRPERFEVYLRS